MISNIRDLKKVMKLCQDHGVTSFKADGIEMIIPLKAQKHTRIDYDAFPEADVAIPTFSPVNVQETANQSIEPIDMPDELDEEQLMFYSSKSEPQ